MAINKKKNNDSYIDIKIVLIDKLSENIKSFLDIKNNKLIINFNDKKNNFLEEISLFKLKKIYFK